MSSRTAKILALAYQRDRETLSNLNIPKYESTKCTTRHEESLFFKYSNLQDANVSSSNEKPRNKESICYQRSNSVKRKLEFSPKCTENSSLDSQDSDPFSGGSDDTYVPDSTDESHCSSPNYVKNFTRSSHNGSCVTTSGSKSTTFVSCTTTSNPAIQDKVEEVDPNNDLIRNSQRNSKETDNVYNLKKNEVQFTVAKKTNGKRIRDKRQCCYVCNKILTNNMARHFETVHSTDPEVAKVLIHPKGSKSRRHHFENLIRVGNFYHNCNVLATKQGELILVKCPSEVSVQSYDDFGPCPYCLGFFSRKYMWHHVKYCRKIRSSVEVKTNKGTLNESNAILFEIIGTKVDENFRRDIIDSLRYDDVSNTLKEDSLIVKLGSFMYEKYGNCQNELIRQSMRQLGRLKLKLHETLDNTQNLSEFLTAKNFDYIINATKDLCFQINVESESNSSQVPSLALKIGHLLRKCIAIESGTALRQGQLSRHTELKSLLELMDLEWSIRISSKALTLLHRRKINTTQLLPLTSDIMKLNRYLEDQMKHCKSLLISKCSPQIWTQLASVTLSRIILFNKRRSGEAAKMKLSDYKNRPHWSQQSTEELKKSLTSFEAELAKRLFVVKVIGKRGRIVHIILTEETRLCIDLLVTTREKCQISSDNHYVFARSQKSLLNFHLRGHDCLRKACIEANLENAEITSTKLRKYIATVSQIFNLKENECDWLARHLGHDIRVHRDFYRLHESAVELTKISRLLIAVDKGEANRYAGKSLEEINVEDLPALQIDDEEKNMDNSDNEEENTGSITLSEENDNGLEISSDKRNKKSASRNKKTVVSRRKKWTETESSCVLDFFKSSIKKRNLPGKAECQNCMDNYPDTLKNRKWTDIKFYLKNYYTRISKMTSFSE